MVLHLSMWCWVTLAVSAGLVLTTILYQPDRPGQRDPATIRRKVRFGDVPDLTPEDHRQRGDAADALWRELVRRVRERA